MQLEVDSIVEGKVTHITNFGVFVELPTGQTGMVHISEVAQTYVKEIRDFVKEDQQVKVKVLQISPEGKISLSMKKAVAPAPRTPARVAPSPGRPGDYEWHPAAQQSASFEDMLNKFKQTSDEKILDLKRSVDGKHGGFSRRNQGNR